MPSLFLSVRRVIVLLSLAVVAVAFSGCQTGGVPGEGPGIKGFTEGELNGNVSAPLDVAVAAVMQELVQMGVLNAEEQRDNLLVEINARMLDEVPLRIRVSRVSDNVSKLRIRVGTGNESVARSIYGRIRGRLQQQFN